MSRPVVVTESIEVRTIQALHALVIQFTRDVVRRAIVLRQLDFSLHAHTKVWRLGERLIRPFHVRCALELCVSAWVGKFAHFRALLERFSESEVDSEEEEDDDDVSLAVRARRKKAETVIRNSEDSVGDGDSGGEQQQQDHAASSRDTQERAASARRWTYTHRAIYAPFVYAPDIIAPSHPFGIYAPGAMPESVAPSRNLHNPAYEDDGYEDEEDEDDDLIPAETDEEALETELSAEAQLDAADALAAAAYEAQVWRELRGTHDAEDDSDAGAHPRRRKRRSANTEVAVDDARHPMGLRKRRKGALGGWTTPVDMLKSPDGVRVRSAAIIEDSDSDDEYLG
jgi:hypothetical protein